MSFKSQSARPMVALLVVFVLSACSTTPPEHIDADGQRTQQICEERPAGTGSRLGRRVCRTVVVEESAKPETERTAGEPERD
ncbi:MAG: hypothetical protein ACNS61_15290 [Candidatus Wenzhouxiangella sp. M2_3B_020]